MFSILEKVDYSFKIPTVLNSLEPGAGSGFGGPHNDAKQPGDGYSEDVEKGEVKTWGEVHAARTGQRRPQILSWTFCVCGVRQRFEGQAVELSQLRDVESGSCFRRSRSFGAFKRETAGATLVVTAAWFASFMNKQLI